MGLAMGFSWTRGTVRAVVRAAAFTSWSTAQLEGYIGRGEKPECVEGASHIQQPARLWTRAPQNRCVHPRNGTGRSRPDAETRLQQMLAKRAGVETLHSFYGSRVGETREHDPRFTARRHLQEGASEMSGGSARSELGWRFIHSPSPKASMLALTCSEGLRRTRWRA